MVSRSITSVYRSSVGWKAGRKAFANGMTNASNRSLMTSAPMSSGWKWSTVISASRVLNSLYALSRKTRFPLFPPLMSSSSVRSAEIASKGVFMPRMRIRAMARRIQAPGGLSREGGPELAQDPCRRAPDGQAVDGVRAIAQWPLADEPFDDLDGCVRQKERHRRVDYPAYLVL